MELLTPGEKIKKLRTELGLKQDDLTNDEISKSLISMIEGNKRGLTEATASIISERLNKHYAALGKNITPEYLLETPADQIKKMVSKEKEELKELIKAGNVNEKLFELVYNKVKGWVDEWELSKEKVELLVIKGDYYYFTYKYNEALKEYSGALVHYVEERNYSQLARMYNFIGASYQMLMLIDQAITNYTRAYDIAVEHNTENKMRLKMDTTYNIILCYRKLERFDMALSQIMIFKEIEGDEELKEYYKDKITLLEANTYRDIRNYERAKKLYEKLLQREKQLDCNIRFFAYQNLSNLYLVQGNTKEALQFINRAATEKHRVLPDYLPGLYLAHAKCHLVMDELDKAIEVLEKGLSLALKIDRTNMIIDLNFALIQVYTRLKDYNKAIEYLQKVEPIILEKNIKTQMDDLYIFYAEIYLKLEDMEKCFEYMTKNRHDYLAIK